MKILFPDPVLRVGERDFLRRARRRLRNGDRVTHLDGHAIEELDERQRDAYFCTPDRHYRVTVVRGGEVLDIQVVNLNEKTRWH